MIHTIVKTKYFNTKNTLRLALRIGFALFLDARLVGVLAVLLRAAARLETQLPPRAAFVELGLVGVLVAPHHVRRVHILRVHRQDGEDL